MSTLRIGWEGEGVGTEVKGHPVEPSLWWCSNTLVRRRCKGVRSDDLRTLCDVL